MKAPLEHAEQRALVEWWGWMFPKVFLMAVPNGGFRNLATAGRLKAEGVRPGVPDLFVPEWLLWIEMKRTKGGRLSPAQIGVIAELERIGHTVLVCPGWQSGQEQVLKFARERAKEAR